MKHIPRNITVGVVAVLLMSSAVANADEVLDWNAMIPPPALTRAEVKAVGELNSPDRPQDRTDVARYFAVVSAAYAWNQAARQVSAARGTSLSENARSLALLNMAISDGLVSSMETKYHYVFWRPITAIRAGDTDGNGCRRAEG